MLALEIVTPDGVALTETEVSVVVLRRHERRFDVGSEIAIFPRHGPMLVRIPIAPARYEKGGETVHLALDGGFAEVRMDRVIVVTPRCARIPAVADPVAEAIEVCASWRAEGAQSRRTA